MLTGVTPKDRFDELVKRCRRAFRKPRARIAEVTRRPNDDPRLTESAELYRRQQWLLHGVRVSPKEAKAIVDDGARAPKHHGAVPA